MKPFIIDIETTGRQDADAFLPTIAAPANYKDETKRNNYVKERREQLLDSAALDAALGCVLCVGILRNGAAPQFLHDQNERQLLHQVWLTLNTREASERFVTFNGHRFDFPFLVRRSFALGVPLPEWFPREGRFLRHLFCDLAELWACGDRSELISLDRLARLCGLPGKAGNGADFAKLWEQNRKAALAYLEQELRLTLALWNHLGCAAKPSTIEYAHAE